ncbi:dihydroorotate dehydrogenase [Pseudogracilibacillus auburnensis]|uniref:Dihydroorotate dehydrogenase n=1 Tax=Pseudogracilibacillus auburnensis TaxID=1494959 RepID=A0A2V3VXI1_9BACI|nr:dihydroorotate dehydrogenase [Pseudogracilibacillus auburnensis]PXW84765.1 dihydroorotate dehydrogenase (NAD+) catalytic subunit [Pseudogracilibacillus auburnensis]
MEKLNLAVQIGKLHLKNPIMPASGAFGFEMESIFDFNKLGAVVPKSITKYPRGGNATPRVCEVNGGMINSIGIQSKGLPYYVEHIIPAYKKYDTPLIASISADSVDEYAEMSEIIGNTEGVLGIELNISCPNLKGDGKAFGMDANISYELVKKVKGVTEQPIITKLTPNVTSIQEIARACEEAGSDGLNVANTLLAMAIDIHTKEPKIGNVLGGISGPAVKPIIVRMIYQVSQVCSIPIVGCGGVMNADDAIEMILAGATAVQVGTASFINPMAMIEIIEGIEAYMKKYEVKDINDIVGKVSTPSELATCQA